LKVFEICKKFDSLGFIQLMTLKYGEFQTRNNFGQGFHMANFWVSVSCPGLWEAPKCFKPQIFTTCWPKTAFLSKYGQLFK